jgi:uncharacterized protein YbbC (DUF1343 family)/CubicO group peptidase (beta-lactamase class C family)
MPSPFRLVARPRKAVVSALAAMWLATSPAAAPLPPDGAPQERADRFGAIAPLVDAAIARHELPGAVVVVGRGDAVLYHRAFGDRAVEPAREPMTEDTIFDLASLTKVVATTPSVMQLVEAGKIRLADPIARFLPEFAGEATRAITIQELLTHTSGFAPDLPLDVEFQGTEEAIRRAAAQPLAAPPGERFIYSDINFFVLGRIVGLVSGERLDRYARAHVFEPLGMADTMFLPPVSLQPRIAPTERCRPLAWPCGDRGVPFLRGVVHDPTSRRMGGVAGHAGAFSTAADLSRFCRMLLGGGRLGDVRVLSPATVARMTSRATPAGMKDVRGLGWDIDTSYSSNRGDLFPEGRSYGHTGFTGTSLWIDPTTDSYVIFLSNRVHPDGKGDVNALRGEIATVAAAAISDLDSRRATLRQAQGRPAERSTLAGIDVLAAEAFAPLRGKRVGLLTNQTGRLRDGTSTIDALAAAPGVRLVALFSPEHGIRGAADAAIASSRDARTGLPVYSLYGATIESRRPTPAMLAGLDVLVVDLQDVGARFYTYPAAVALVLEAAAARKLPVAVLDRPNPIGGDAIEGPLQDPGGNRYVGFLPMPIRHGLTIGELARLFNGEAKIGADLTVVPMKGWSRSRWFDETGLPWVNPSPNMRSLAEATLYPGIGALEQTNVSVGRGTDSPFEQIGAPWIDGVALAAALNARDLPGIRFYPVTFTPAAGAKFGATPCHGVFMIVTDRDRLRPVRVGLEIASALSKMGASELKLEDAATLFGPRSMLARIEAGEDPAAIAADWAAGEQRWRDVTRRYLLY